MEKNLRKLLLVCGCTLVAFTLIESIIAVMGILSNFINAVANRADLGRFISQTIWGVFYALRFMFTQLAIASLCLCATHRLSPLFNPFKRK